MRNINLVIIKLVSYNQSPNIHKMRSYDIDGYVRFKDKVKYTIL